MNYRINPLTGIVFCPYGFDVWHAVLKQTYAKAALLRGFPAHD